MGLRAVIVSMLQLGVSPCLGARICLTVKTSSTRQDRSFEHLTYHRYHYGA